MVALTPFDKRFVRKLKEFAEHGYAFNQEYSLRKGTQKDHDAKGTQREAFDAYTKGLGEGHRHGYFEIPTGVGKTALFISLVKNYLDAVDEKDGQRALIVVPSEKLAVQTAQALAKFLPKLAPTIKADDDSGKEIDWEHSHIGLQYGKIKHADRKPRVLITTYQSLNRDREYKIYPPKEYGMVIYDEGHALTADQYGLAVDKFKDAIQLAVSATPEYSEEKTVASRLPHRYYQLPISEAINRGDLCNVRPVLLKTNYTVNKVKFKEFVEKSQGRKLSDAAITTLLNQQTRNQAAMEAYLLGKDPDSGEQYLGQNGMIFCGTTDHVDDFTRQFNTLMEKTKYRPVRQWLNEEAIELIAPVHGKIRGAYLRKGMLTNGNGRAVIEGRKYEGNKEWYSEEEIFDLHAKGKILLLASVKKLKEGYDSPRDSIIIDTVDRLSKVDATQINGRGFRLNPPNPDQNDSGNPDKTCTVINMVDKNTHELYADDPAMLPIYAAEVIEGAEFRRPAKRKHIMRMHGKQPPDLSDNLETADFKLITNVEVVREVSDQNKRKREKGLGVPDGVWSPSDLAKKLAIKHPSAIQIIGILKDQILNPTAKVARFRNLDIPREAFVFYRQKGGGGTGCGIKQEWGEKLLTEYQGAGNMPGTWSMIEFATQLQGRDSRGIIRSIRNQFDSDPRLTVVEYRGVRVPKNSIIPYTDPANGARAWSIKTEIGKQIVESFPKLGKKTEDILSASDLDTIMGPINSGRRAINILVEYIEKHPEAKIIPIYNISIPREAIIEYEWSGEVCTGLKKDQGKRIAQAFNQFQTETEKPSNVWSAFEFGQELGRSQSNASDIICSIETAFNKHPIPKTVEFEGVTIPSGSIVAYRYNNIPCKGIVTDIGRKIAANMAKRAFGPKPNDVWSSIELAREMGLKDTAGYAVIAGLMEQAESNSSAQTIKYRDVEIPRDALVKYDYRDSTATGIRADAGKKIVTAYKIKKEKPLDVWGVSDLNTALNSDHLGGGIVTMVRKQLSDTTKNSAKVKGVEIPRDALVYYEYDGKKRFGIKEIYALKLLEVYEVDDPKTAAKARLDSLKKQPITPRKSNAHMSDEERRNAKNSKGGRGK
jgi:superfamily II DNA or RNA helicase